MTVMLMLYLLLMRFLTNRINSLLRTVKQSLSGNKSRQAVHVVCLALNVERSTLKLVWLTVKTTRQTVKVVILVAKKVRLAVKIGSLAFKLGRGLLWFYGCLLRQQLLLFNQVVKLVSQDAMVVGVVANAVSQAVKVVRQGVI